MKSLVNKICFFFIFGFLIPGTQVYNAISAGGSLTIGYDSNPLRLSNNEILDLGDRPYLLGGANAIQSRFLQYNFDFKFFSKKGLLSRLFNNKKTIFNIRFADKTYFENASKSGYNILFKIDQQLGDYRHFYIDYFFMPSFYLREYEDLDYILDTNDIYHEAYRSCYFDIEKITFSYQSPLKNKQSKIKVGLSYERQLFDKYFTEFDLNIIGLFGQVNFLGNGRDRLMLYYSYENADNFRYLDGSFSTLNMDRGYMQKRLKLSFTEPLENNQSYGFIIDSYYRYNSSDIYSDELHYKRSHNDITLSLWCKLGKHKIMFSDRRRTTTSPRDWVNDLKTFKRYTLTYTINLGRVKL